MLLVLQLECITQALLLTVYCTELCTLTAYIILFLLLRPFVNIELKRPSVGKHLFDYF